MPATAHEPKDAPVTFEYLARYRKLLREFCRSHVPSLAPFASDKFAVFAVTLDKKPTEFRHITSTSTCFSSLDLCPDESSHKLKSHFQSLGERFAESAINSDLGDVWRSDKAAEVYCSCRGLPYVLTKLKGWHPKIDDHLWRITYQLKSFGRQPRRFAIGEARPPVGNETRAEAKKAWYPPNAYHTYWALEILRALDGDKFKEGRAKSRNFRALLDAKEQMRLWARQQLGVQIALHVGKSSKLDSDQLAWSLAILVSEPNTYESNLVEQDLIIQAFSCLFGTQQPIGTWRHYEPLFHYPHVGNAYCYVFETFAALLGQALKPKAEFLRIVLKERASDLVRLWKYADATKAEVHDSKGNLGGGFGWTSGHTVSRGVESWATASVFEYAQTLRILLGIWTRDQALNSLNHKVTSRTKKDAIVDLHKRTRTWTHPDLPDLLASMFINPMAQVPSTAALDPDRPLIGEKSSRSAIFFGPPGTGKTFLISALADAIGWKYVELHPSHFVSEGLPDVQRTADRIFSELMELDHVVILFDEIDELVREREMEPDQFGRFLTTSMLPRLAELWKARKVIYFVATNHIEFFDRAVTRSERFDAIIFLSPPSFEIKCGQILKLLRDRYKKTVKFGDDVSREAICAAFPRASCDEAEKIPDGEARKAARAAALPPSNTISKFALIRFDELDGLALQLSDILGKSKIITAEMLSESLKRLKDGKARSLGEYCRFTSDPDAYERFDASKNASWIVTEIDGLDLKQDELPAPVKRVGDRTVGEIAALVEAAVGDYKNVKVPGFAPEPAQSDGAKLMLGAIRLKKL
jgi:predicted ATPase